MRNEEALAKHRAGYCARGPAGAHDARGRAPAPALIANPETDLPGSSAWLESRGVAGKKARVRLVVDHPGLFEHWGVIGSWNRGKSRRVREIAEDE